MRRAAALSLMGGFVTASLTGCEALDCTIPTPPLPESRSSLSRFGVQIYAHDDVARAMGLVAGCGASMVRVQINGNFDFADAVFAAAAAHGVRVIILTDFFEQPVDTGEFAAAQTAIQNRYARYRPVWEIWNEPNLAHYWGATPDVEAYSRVAIATAKALRAAGSEDVWSGGTSGIDFDWILKLKALGAFEVMNGCAVHSYEDPCLAYSHYGTLVTLLPKNVLIHTTETCIPQEPAQAEFLRSMWYIHRDIGLPTMIWCEFRDGTAGSSGANALPYGLVSSNYALKPSYRMARTLLDAAPT